MDAVIRHAHRSLTTDRTASGAENGAPFGDHVWSTAPLLQVTVFTTLFDLSNIHTYVCIYIYIFFFLIYD